MINWNFYSNKKILITGGAGMLGNAFTELLKYFSPSSLVLSLSHIEMDVTDLNFILNFSQEFRPDIIIHCAANVNADYCENHPDLCFETQVIGTKNIITLAKKCDSLLFYPQSFLIYGNNTIAVDENTIPEPLSVYGKFKLLAENYIIKDYQKFLIVRMGGFFGEYELDKNFIGKFISHISNLNHSEINEIKVGSRVWQPSYTRDLALNSLLLISLNKTGIYNMASHGHVSFFDLAKSISNILNLDSKIRILPANQMDISNKDIAKRPEYLVMSNKRLQQERLDIQVPWEISLRKYLNHHYFLKKN